MPSTAWKDLVEGESLDSACKTRKQKKIVCKIDFSKVSEYEKKGYKRVSDSSKMAKMEYVKTKQEQFEDRVWLLLHKLEFTSMNANSYFGLPTENGSLENPKQIDVFAYDGKRALVIECKRADVEDDAQLKQFDFKKDLEEIRLHMEVQENAIKARFENPDVDIAFVFFTSKYKLSNANIKLAKSYGIAVLNEFDLDYYEKMYNILKSYAKVQILSDIFGDKPVKSVGCKVPAIRGSLAGNEVFTFLIHPHDLLQISFIAHKKMNGPDDGAYQRIVNKSRLSDIQEFLKNQGYFANNIIINLNANDLSFDPAISSKSTSEVGTPEVGTLTLPGLFKCAYVIDGQHRLFGYLNTEQEYTEYVPVTAFHNLDTCAQAKIFVQINSNQKKVNTNLLIKVQSESKRQSNDVKEWIIPVAISAVEEMSKESKNPLFGKVKDEYDSESKGEITLRAIQSGFERSGLLGRNISSSRTFNPGPLFANGDDLKESTARKIKDFLTNAFKIIQSGCPEHWAKNKAEGGFLTTSNGFEALLGVFYDLLGSTNDLLGASEDSSENLFSSIKKYVKVIGESFGKMDDLEIESYKKRSSYAGIDTTINEIELKIHEQYSDFDTPSLKQYIENTDKKYSEHLQNALPNLQNLIVNQVKSVVVREYGSDWHRSKEFSDIGSKLNNDRYASGEENRTLESFIDLDKAYEIIRLGNWKLFNKIFAVKNPAGKSREFVTSWISDLQNYSKKLGNLQKITSDEYAQFEKIDDALRSQFSVYNNAEEIETGGEDIDNRGIIGSDGI